MKNCLFKKREKNCYFSDRIGLRGGGKKSFHHFRYILNNLVVDWDQNLSNANGAGAERRRVWRSSTDRGASPRESYLMQQRRRASEAIVKLAAPRWPATNRGFFANLQ